MTTFLEALANGGIPADQAESRFTFLLKKAEKFGEPIGVGPDLFISLLQETSDWSFIIQIDALHETACRELLSRLLSLDGKPPAKKDDLSKFIAGLGYQGRSSVIKLLGLAGVPIPSIKFLGTVRDIRNSYAHDIRCVTKPMIEIIEAREDKAALLRNLYDFEKPGDNEQMLKDIREKGDLLRFLILDTTMDILHSLHRNLGDKGIIS